jgi:tRNA threonylcarbamoyladenosine biosynthesis protein TsaE
VDKIGNELLMYHFDLYRVKSITELYDLGYEEFLQGDGICLIEWAEMLGDLLPERRYDVRLSAGAGENERRIEINKVEK